MRVKRLLVLLLTAVLLLSLSACGKKETPEKVLRFPDTKWTTLNPYLANASEDMLNDFSQARLYRRFANEDRETVYIRPELAESEPQQMDAEGKVWRIKIRPGLFFTDSQGQKTDRPINAAVFEASLKAALDPKLAQRAGDNLGQYITILNAREYFRQTPEAPVDWSAVGIKAVDELTLELTLTTAATQRHGADGSGAFRLAAQRGRHEHRLRDRRGQGPVLRRLLRHEVGEGIRDHADEESVLRVRG